MKGGAVISSSPGVRFLSLRRSSDHFVNNSVQIQTAFELDPVCLFWFGFSLWNINNFGSVSGERMLPKKCCASTLFWLSSCSSSKVISISLWVSLNSNTSSNFCVSAVICFNIVRPEFIISTIIVESYCRSARSIV